MSSVNTPRGAEVPVVSRLEVLVQSVPMAARAGLLALLAACADDAKVSDPRADEATDTGDTPADTDTGTPDTDTQDTDTDDTDTDDTDTDDTDTDDTDTGTEVDPDAMTVMAKEDCETLFINGDGAERMDVDNLSDSNYVFSNGAYATYEDSARLFEDTNFGRSNATESVFVCVINGNGEAAEFSTVEIIPGTDANPEQTITIQGQGIDLEGGALTAWFMSAEPRQLLVEDEEDENAPWLYAAGPDIADLQY